jgi:hypothetical protein
MLIATRANTILSRTMIPRVIHVLLRLIWRANPVGEFAGRTVPHLPRASGHAAIVRTPANLSRTSRTGGVFSPSSSRTASKCSAITSDRPWTGPSCTNCSRIDRASVNSVSALGDYRDFAVRAWRAWPMTAPGEMPVRNELDLPEAKSPFRRSIGGVRVLLPRDEIRPRPRPYCSPNSSCCWHQRSSASASWRVRSPSS